MKEDLYCKIYVNCDQERGVLLTHIARIVKGEISVRTVTTDVFEITVMANEDYEEGRTSEDNGFVFYPYYLEVEPLTEDGAVYKAAVGDFLKSLWALPADAVAACDFEEQLPQKAA